MFDDVLASVRIGAAKVDTIPETSTVQPGETLPVRVEVDGGNVDQDIEAIELELTTRRKVNDARQTYEISSQRVTGPFTIEEGDQETFEAEIPIHRETPVTTMDVRRNKAEVWIDTDLEIDRAIDGDDTDYLDIEPTGPMAAMLEAVEQAGHDLKEVSVDNDRIGVGNERADLPVDQEFVFKPTSGRDYKELEIHFVPRDAETHVLVEFDYRMKSEQFESVRIDHADYDVDSLRQTFERVA
jgi:sporulation-control protein